MFGDVCFEYVRQQAPVERLTKRLGLFPIMVKSRICPLWNMSRRELVKNNEETNELGGYFVVNGNERLGRPLPLHPRQSHSGLLTYI